MQDEECHTDQPLTDPVDDDAQPGDDDDAQSGDDDDDDEQMQSMLRADAVDAVDVNRQLEREIPLDENTSEWITQRVESVAREAAIAAERLVELTELHDVRNARQRRKRKVKFDSDDSDDSDQPTEQEVKDNEGLVAWSAGTLGRQYWTELCAKRQAAGRERNQNTANLLFLRQRMRLMSQAVQKIGADIWAESGLPIPRDYEPDRPSVCLPNQPPVPSDAIPAVRPAPVVVSLAVERGPLFVPVVQPVAEPVVPVRVEPVLPGSLSTREPGVSPGMTPLPATDTSEMLFQQRWENYLKSVEGPWDSTETCQ